MNARLLVVLLSSLYISGCAHPLEETMSAWVGHRDSELISAWGVPDKRMKLHNGKQVYTWRRPWRDGGGYYICRQSFTIDAHGVIESWRFEDC